MEYEAFKEDEIPYQILDEYGLTQEMIEDLPMSALDAILDGRRSPLLPITVKDEDGTRIVTRTRFILYRMEDGKVDIMFDPLLTQSDISMYNEKEQEALIEGKAIIANSPLDGKNKCFVQIDPETRQVMFVATPVIGRNLQLLMDNFSLNSSQIKNIQNGDPVTFTDSNEQVTAGIDLNEKTGIRIEKGDIEKWLSHRTRVMDKYNFGIFGCWICDEDGKLSYTAEDDYTEEIWNQQKNIIETNNIIRR